MSDGEPTIDSTEELRTALQSVLRRAYAGGVAVDGGWECRNGADHPDWDVVVTEVEKAEPTD